LLVVRRWPGMIFQAYYSSGPVIPPLVIGVGSLVNGYQISRV